MPGDGRVGLVDEDGSPRGPKRFVLWNPPYLDGSRMERRSSNEEAQRLMVGLLRRGVQTIAFARTRIVAELLYRYTSEALAKVSPSLAKAVEPYRALVFYCMMAPIVGVTVWSGFDYVLSNRAAITAMARRDTASDKDE